MDVTAVSTLITSVGFPIAACVALFYLLNKQGETLNELKIVMTKLIDKLNADDIDIKVEKK